MAKECVECGKKLPDSSESMYCSKCDELLDRKFDEIQSNIIVFKELRDDEIEILNKFDKEDIIELYLEVYESLREDGKFNEDEGRILNKIQKEFNLTEEDIGKDKIVNIKDCRKIKKENKLVCYKCEKPLKEEFSFCPYCGKKILK